MRAAAVSLALLAALAPLTAAAQEPPPTLSARLQEQGGPSARLVLAFVEPARVLDWRADGQELVIRFDRPLVGGDLEALAQRSPRWLTALLAGYDSLLVQTPQPAAFSVTGGAEPGEVVVEIRLLPVTDPAQLANQAELRLRADIALARAALEADKPVEARQRLLELRAAHPDDTDVLSLLAAAEDRLRRPWKAQAAYAEALELAPDNPGLRVAHRLARRAAAPTVSVTPAISKVRNGDLQRGVTVAATGQRVGEAVLESELQLRQVDALGVRTSGGGTRDIHATRKQLRSLATLPIEGDLFGSAGVILADGGPLGLELGAEWVGRTESYTAELVWHEPAWTYLEGLVGHGWRDRVEGTALITLDRRTLLTLRGGASRYGVEGAGDAAKTLHGGLTLSHTVPALPVGLWSVEYTADGEYVLDNEKRRLQDGALYRPLPVVTRETHGLLLGWTLAWRDLASVTAFGGYTIDRYNADGPAYGLRGSLVVNETLDLQAQAIRSETSQRGTTGVTDTASLTARVRF